jgi:hypothetical protein
MEDKIVRLLDASYHNPSVFSVELQANPIGIYDEPIHHVVEIRSMRDDRRMDFIGLANTFLDDSHARLIADALRSLPRRIPGEEPETLEMHQMVFQAGTRTELLNASAAGHAGVTLLLSDPNGPALRDF